MRFQNGMRVVVSSDDRGMRGHAGKVVRLLRRSANEAWIEMDKDLPMDLRSFPVEDPRRNHICLFADECKPEKK